MAIDWLTQVCLHNRLLFVIGVVLLALRALFVLHFELDIDNVLNLKTSGLKPCLGHLIECINCFLRNVSYGPARNVENILTNVRFNIPRKMKTAFAGSGTAALPWSSICATVKRSRIRRECGSVYTFFSGARV